ncbi:hypothetical protein EYR40_003833 [Pleurotus pulmonarius]|nr:hypothetical protein EYR36_007594 [Pleurotus pulmonarius]KAF4605050.1 hypothetical protein EYR40_003833 [Pleurotus pulmonarius]KAF4606543.1 hypothetical protein EYR38_000597 [Pleurotus pulmonarius]
MFIFLISQALAAWFAFLLPCYSTYKVINQTPPPQAELQRWSTYWVVLGAFLAFEHLAEWFVSWFPFYWEAKTIFLLFLALPQTEGSTYIYNVYLKPFFIKNEADLDAGIVSAQRNALGFIQTRVNTAWEFVLSLLNKSPSSPPVNGVPGQQQAQRPAAFDSVMGLWKTYGPAVMGAIQGSKPASTPGSTPSATASSTSIQTPSAFDRRPSSEGSLPPAFPEPQLNH